MNLNYSSICGWKRENGAYVADTSSVSVEAYFWMASNRNLDRERQEEYYRVLGEADHKLIPGVYRVPAPGNL